MTGSMRLAMTGRPCCFPVLRFAKENIFSPFFFLQEYYIPYFVPTLIFKTDEETQWVQREVRLPWTVERDFRPKPSPVIGIHRM